MGAFQRLYTLPVADFRLRQHSHREAVHVLTAGSCRCSEFGREREGVDLSKVVLTHHNLRNHGKTPLPLERGEAPKLKPLTEAGSGSVQEKEKARLAEIIAEGERPVRRRTDRRRPAGLREQRDQGQAAGIRRSWSIRPRTTPRSSSPTRRRCPEILNAVMDALAAHSDDEQAGAGVGSGAGGAEGRAARPGAALRGAAGEGGTAGGVAGVFRRKASKPLSIWTRAGFSPCGGRQRSETIGMVPHTKDRGLRPRAQVGIPKHFIPEKQNPC